MSKKAFKINDLLTTRLVVNNAYDQLNLLNDRSNANGKIPPNIAMVEIINVFNHDLFPKEKCGCAICGARKYGSGFTISLSNGQKALIGRDCGQKKFQASWLQLSRSFELKRSGQDAASWLFNIVKYKDDILAHEQEWYDTAQKIENLKLDILNKLGDVKTLLMQANTTDGGLIQEHRDRLNPLAKETKNAPSTIQEVYNSINFGKVRFLGSSFNLYKKSIETFNDIKAAIKVGENLSQEK